ncbi:Cell wall assembly regulator [Bachmanniomyces sp. S44760]|nr:Cell wall assembly regulator [Bachmanniomyces sp. S44760]
MTSYDRHASHDSPYRTGQHMPLNQSRHAPLTSIATSANDSRPDLNAPYPDDNGQLSSRLAPNGWPGTVGTDGSVQTPGSPYSPGMRSSLARSQPTTTEQYNSENVTPGEIQMQSFQEGLPPPPPVTHSWKRIDRWAEDNYEELWDQLSEGCTQNDVNELEHELDCSLPIEVRESWQVHDGQERGGRPTGILFGCMLLDCEEIVQEWKNWRTVNEEYHLNQSPSQIRLPNKGFGGSSTNPSSQHATNPLWRQELQDKQDSQPPRAIQKAYAHPGWIPLARDWGGNNIAVDLAPGPMGKWGQIIIFGRDYDCKYVVARSWSAFLAMVADDMSSEKVFVDEETQELKLREFKSHNVEPAYLDILRWRMDQKYGRKGPKRKPANGGLGLNTNLGNANNSNHGSPYQSPTEERGRSPHRFQQHGHGSQSPRGTIGAAVGISSPLAQVSDADKAGNTMQIGEVPKSKMKTHSNLNESKLVDAPTPTSTTSPFFSKGADGVAVNEDHDKENTKEPQGLGMQALEEMKSVDI